MKRFLLLTCVIICISLNMRAQNDTIRYEITKSMPVFYQKLKEQLTFPMAWGKSPIKEFSEWRNEARNKLIACMSNLPPKASEYDTRIVATEQRNGYKAHKIEFNISAWSRIPAYLLIPSGEGPFPAIVMLHDHGAHFSIGKEKVIRPFEVTPEVMEDADNWVEKCYDNQYIGDYFAQNGYVVLAIDALFWGERGRKEGVDYDSQQALASNFFQMGASWSAFINIDDVRSGEYLASLPYVDEKRIGCLGFSMGAYRSWMMSSISDVISASASVCWINTTEHLMTLTNNQNKGGSAFSMLLPDIRRYMDYPHVASIACPKPTLFFNGREDKLFPVVGVEDSYRILTDVWKSQDAEERLVTRIWDEKHFFNREMQAETLRFFNKWLK